MRQADMLCRVLMPLPSGGLTSGSTRPLDSFSFKIECSDDGRMLLARGGLSSALETAWLLRYEHKQNESARSHTATKRRSNNSFNLDASIECLSSLSSPV